MRTISADKLWGLKSGQCSPGQKGKKAGLARARQHPGGLTSHLSSPEAPDPSTQPQPSQRHKHPRRCSPLYPGASLLPTRRGGGLQSRKPGGLFREWPSLAYRSVHLGLKASERGHSRVIGCGGTGVQVKGEEVRRGSKQGEQRAVITQLLGARHSVRSTTEVSTGNPQKSLRWVTRLREARQLAQGHTACLVRLRHGHLYLFTVNWLCLQWCPLLCSIMWDPFPRVGSSWHHRSHLVSRLHTVPSSHASWGALWLWG